MQPSPPGLERVLLLLPRCAAPPEVLLSAHRTAGTGHSKKWKYTIRTAHTNQTIGAWLAEQRLDGPGGRGRWARGGWVGGGTLVQL